MCEYYGSQSYDRQTTDDDDDNSNINIK